MISSLPSVISEYVGSSFLLQLVKIKQDIIPSKKIIFFIFICLIDFELIDILYYCLVNCFGVNGILMQSYIIIFI